jgi:hypothetical protein
MDTTTRSVWRDSRAISVLCGVVAGVSFFGVAWQALNARHPAEDAYILFRYAENIAQGLGITFNPAGPRAEGATDFLWLLLTTALTWLGFEVAVACALINAFGAALTAYLLTRLVSLERPSKWYLAGWSVLSIFVAVTYHGALAAYEGFGSSFYPAFSLLVAYLGLHGGPKAQQRLPFVALVLALIRPDGVLLGIGFCLVAAFELRRTPYWRGLLLNGCGAALVGLAYFVARYTYFGLLLPLPLIVKSRVNLSQHAEGFPDWLKTVFENLPGLGTTANWLLESGIGPFVVTLCMFAVATIALEKGREGWLRVALWMSPFLLHAAALVRMHQTQNLFFRFQAPTSLAIVATVAVLGCYLLRHGRTWLRVLAAVPFALELLWSPTRVAGVAHMLNPDANDYLHYLAPMLGSYTTEHDVVVLTEAGRIPFWSSAQFVDAIGLNTVETALEPIDLDYLRELRPQLIVFDHFDGLLFPEALQPESQVVLMDPSRLKAAVAPRLRDIPLDRGSYDELPIAGERYTPLVLAKYLAESPEYSTYVVFEQHYGYDQVFGIRKDWAVGPSVVQAIEQALRARPVSHLQTRACWEQPAPAGTTRSAFLAKCLDRN